VEVNGGRRRAMDGTPIEEDAHASASQAHPFPAGAGRDPGHHCRRAA